MEVRCSVCKRIFDKESTLFNFLETEQDCCPECIRQQHLLNDLEQKNSDNQQKLIETQSKLQEQHLKQQKELMQEQLSRQERLHQSRITETKRLQQEQFSKTEANSIKDKIYQLVINRSLDVNGIRQIINLLITQHPNHTYFIYDNLVQVGDPYAHIVDAIVLEKLRDKIENSNLSDGLSFQEKACAYFIPSFDGWEFQLFEKKLINQYEFNRAVNNMLVELQKQSKEYLNSDIEKYTFQIKDLASQIQANNNEMKALKKEGRILSFFGGNGFLFSREVVVIMLLYLVLVRPYSVKTFGVVLGFSLVWNITLIIIKYQKKTRYEELRKLEAEYAKSNDAAEHCLRTALNDRKAKVQELNRTIALLESYLNRRVGVRIKTFI